MAEFISIVVCTFNRAPVLQRMLESFFRQEQLNEIQYELLIIDNNSNDNTAMTVQEFLSKGNTKYFIELNQGLSFARNRGVGESKGDVISFLDDDVLVHENWLASVKACFDEEDADVVGGRVLLKFEALQPQWLAGLFRKCLSEVDLGASRKVLCNGDCLYGANLSFRKKVFDLVGLFDIDAGRRRHQLLSGEETHMVRRILANGGKVLYDPNVFVEHLIGSERLQWKYFVKRAGGDGLTEEFFDPEASRGFQFLRVCRAMVEFVKAGYIRYTIAYRTNDSYERKLAEFIFLRQRSYLGARVARLEQQLTKHQEKISRNLRE
jgi:glucosyl-dolichyl phosphate glucuronosyltransferase